MALYQFLHPVDTPLPAEPAVQALWDSILSDPRLYYIVADSGEQLVATCNLSIVPNLTRGARPFGIIENVVTHPMYRRHGLGTTVLRYALTIAWQQNCYKVMLLTGSKQEGTLHFYERAGFKRGIKTGFIAVPENEHSGG
jgi:GNAT superfamily N-acetyltransferase